MNELFFAPPRTPGRGKALVKRLIRTAAGSCALGGLFPGRHEDNWLRIEQHDMHLPGLGSGFHGARLAHISDLHYSPIVLERYLRNCVDTINRLDVDFVAVTGDFITGARFYARRVADILRELNPRVATLACLGNHDYGIFHPKGLGGSHRLADYLANHLAHADIFVMLNESRVFRRDNSAIQFVGLEDYWSSRYDPQRAFEHAHRHMPTVALLHNPDAAKEIAAYGPHWVLSGHTHGTDIKKTPLHKFVMPTQYKRYFAGHYPLGKNRDLYVTRGLGYGRRVNINSRPEITLFTLKDAPAATK